MLTVRTLVEELGLELAAGEAGADAPVRWVHITELEDPTPWLSGGELVLTTGFRLGDEEGQRRFVRRLADYHLAGLGLGTGFDHDDLPGPLVEEAKATGFPLFEVPYELPFIAITEKAFTRLVNEQYEVLQRGIAIHKRLERLVLEERGLDEVVRGLAAALGGAVVVLSPRGETMAATDFRRPLPEEALAAVRREVVERTAGGDGSSGEAAEFAPHHGELAGRSLVLPVATRGSGSPQAWLVAARDTGGLGDFERLILSQAATVVALELMRQRTMRDTERRLAGDVLAEAIEGHLDENELAAGWSRSGWGPRRPCSCSLGPAVSPSRHRPPPRQTSTGCSPTPVPERSWPHAISCCVRWWTGARASTPWLRPSGRAPPSRPSTASCVRPPAGRRPWARSGTPSTRPAARSRPRRSPATAAPRVPPPIATWGRSS